MHLIPHALSGLSARARGKILHRALIVNMKLLCLIIAPCVHSERKLRTLYENKVLNQSVTLLLYGKGNSSFINF